MLEHRCSMCDNEDVETIETDKYIIFICDWCSFKWGNEADYYGC